MAGWIDPQDVESPRMAKVSAHFGGGRPVTASRRWVLGLAFGAAAVVALTAGLYFGGVTDDRGPGAPGRDAGALFGVALPDLNGAEQSLGQWKGRVLVVNFWATWCTPCREEMPQFVRAQTEFGGKGLQFVGIAIDQVDKVQQFAQELRLNYPVLIGGYGAIELSKTFGNRLGALPFTIIVDRAGRVAHTQLGPLNETALKSIIKQLL